MSRWAGLFALFSIGLAAASGAEDPLVVEFADRRTNHFAGRAASIGTIVRGGGAVEGSIAWVLSLDTRPLVRGTARVRHAGPDPTRIDIIVVLPEGRDGIVVDASLAVALVDATGKRLGSNTTKVRIFPEDPFVDRRQWLESLQLALVDPVGTTAAAFEAVGVPFTLVPADLDIAAIRPPVVVVGEGVSWADRPRLPHDLAFLAARGVDVLCLAPLDGTLTLPDTGDEPGEIVATCLRLRRADVVVAIDKRLDDRDWSAAGPTVIRQLAVSADGEAVVVESGDGPRGWPWLEAGFTRRETDTAGGEIIVCGLGIVTHWDETPAARYLFAALLERLSRKIAVDPAHPSDRSSTEPPREPGT